MDLWAAVEHVPRECITYTFVRVIVTCVLSWTLYAVHNNYSKAGADQMTIQFDELITNFVPVTAVGPEDCRQQLNWLEQSFKTNERCEVQ